MTRDEHIEAAEKWLAEAEGQFDIGRYRSDHAAILFATFAAAHAALAGVKDRGPRTHDDP